MEFRAWAAGQPLDQLFSSVIPQASGSNASGTDLVMYVSNVDRFVGADKWPHIVDGWRKAMNCSSMFSGATALYYAPYFAPGKSPYSSRNLPPVTIVERGKCASGNQSADMHNEISTGSELPRHRGSHRGSQRGSNHSTTILKGPPERCPLQRCSGAHKCAWQALAHHLATNRTQQLVEVTKEGKFVEFQRALTGKYAAVHVRDFLEKKFPASWALRPSVLFHIIVGEGGSRGSLEQAVSIAAKAGVHEIWVMDHNIDAPSWKDRSSWPAANGKTIIGTAGAREEDSELWTHAELTSMIEAKVRSACPHPLRLADCGIAATHGTLVHDQRNMLIGFRCVDLQQHATPKASQP